MKRLKKMMGLIRFAWFLMRKKNRDALMLASKPIIDAGIKSLRESA